MQKYGKTLLPVTAVKEAAEMDAVVEASRARDRRELEGMVESLERLRPLFDLAVRCIESPDGLVVRKVPLSVLADESVPWVSR